MSQVGGSRHAIDPPAIESGCSSVACDAVSMVTFLAVLGALTLGFVAFLNGVRRARSAVSFERERLLDEYEAFLAFADRVAAVPAAARPDGGRQMAGSLAQQQAETPGLRQVRTAYRETVMSVPHYDADYGEPLEQHMATELSPELASAVVDGTQLTPAVREPLLASARSAAHDRRVLAEELAEEESDLEDAESRLQSLSHRFEVTDGEGLLDRTFPDLQARWGRLEELEDDCAELLECRQQQLKDRTPTTGTRLQSPTAVSDYLYGDLDVDFPVLDAGTDLLERIRAEKRHTVEALTERSR